MTEPEQDSQPTIHSLEMPFVSVASKGGPHDDESFTAGWEMGGLNALLSLERDHTHTHTQLIHAENREQAELIATHNGYTAAFTEAADGWLTALFAKLAHEPV